MRTSRRERPRALSHVIYEKSPGGVVASAKRTVAYRDEIEAAADRHGVDADTLEAMIFLESAGPPVCDAPGRRPRRRPASPRSSPRPPPTCSGCRSTCRRASRSTEQIAARDSPEQAERLRDRARGDRPALRSRGGDRGRRHLPRDSARALRRRGSRGGLLPHGHRQSRDAIRSFTGARQRPDRRGGGVGGAQLRRALLRLRTGRPRRDLRVPQRPRRRVVAVPVEGAGLARRSSSATATIPTRSPRPPSWRPRRRPWRRSFTPRTRPRSSTIPTRSRSAIDDGELVPLPDEPALGWEPDRDIGELATELDQEPAALPRAAPGGAGDAHLPGRARAQRERCGDPAAGDERGPRSRVPGAARGSQPAGDRRVLAAHDRLVVRHPPRLRVQAPGRRRFSSCSIACARWPLLDYAVEPGAIHVTVSNRGEELLGDD